MSRCLCRKFDVRTERQGDTCKYNGSDVVVNNEAVRIYFDPATALDSTRPAGVAISSFSKYSSCPLILN